VKTAESTESFDSREAIMKNSGYTEDANGGRSNRVGFPTIDGK
jgi:hypothetical protein